MQCYEEIKTSTSNEVPEFIKNSFFNPNFDFDEMLGFTPYNEFN